MTACIVFTRESTKDRAELATYSQEAGVSLPGHAATPHAFYDRQEVLEGAPAEGVVVLEFFHP